MLIDVDLSMDVIDVPDDDALLQASETVTIIVGPKYPEHPPRITVEHDRFADVAHVMGGCEFCIYLNHDREWHPNGGVTDALNQVWRLLDDAVNGRFDPLVALFHPIGGFNPATRGTGTAVVRSFPGTEGKALSIGQASVRTPARIDVAATGSLADRATARNLTVTVPRRLRHGLGRRVADLATRVAGAGGPSTTQLLGALQRSVAKTSPGEPVYLTVAVARSSQPVDGWHLSCGRIHFDQVTRRAFLNAETPASMHHAIGPNLPIEWYDMNDQRPELATRRDARRPAHAFEGLTIAIWGCGALGSWIAETLARAGLAELRLIDPKGVNAGLLVRQNYTENDVGYPKATQLKARLDALSDDVTVTAYPCSATEAINDGCDLIIDATVNEAVAGLATAPTDALLVSVATDAESASLGLLVVGGPDHTPAQVQDAVAPLIVTRPDLEPFHRFWHDIDPADMVLPAPGCSTPTFHGSAADAMGVASTVTNLLGNHIGAATAGIHLINMPHSGLAVPGHTFVEMPA